MRYFVLCTSLTVLVFSSFLDPNTTFAQRGRVETRNRYLDKYRNESELERIRRKRAADYLRKDLKPRFGGEEMAPPLDPESAKLIAKLKEAIAQRRSDEVARLSKLFIDRLDPERAKLRASLRETVSASRPDVAAAQKGLNAIGLDAGPVDGKLGPRSKASLKTFQNHRGLSPTGHPDAATLASLKNISQSSERLRQINVDGSAFAVMTVEKFNQYDPRSRQKPSYMVLGIGGMLLYCGYDYADMTKAVASSVEQLRAKKPDLEQILFDTPKLSEKEREAFLSTVRIKSLAEGAKDTREIRLKAMDRPNGSTLIQDLRHIPGLVLRGDRIPEPKLVEKGKYKGWFSDILDVQNWCTNAPGGIQILARTRDLFERTVRWVIEHIDRHRNESGDEAIKELTKSMIQEYGFKEEDIRLEIQSTILGLLLKDEKGEAEWALLPRL